MNSYPTNNLIVHEIIQSFSLWLCNQNTSQWNHTNISNKHKDKKAAATTTAAINFQSMNSMERHSISV